MICFYFWRSGAYLQWIIKAPIYFLNSRPGKSHYLVDPTSISRTLDPVQATLTPSTSTLGVFAFPSVEFNHLSGFWLYMGQGGITASPVNSVPARPIHSVRWISL